MREYDVVVIGAGQAGIVAARELVRRGLRPGIDMLVLDANPGPGGAWQHRWPTLTVGKAHGIADLPGLPMARVEGEVPAAVAVPEYFGSYETAFDLGVIRPVRVAKVTEAAEGAEAAGGQGSLVIHLDGGNAIRAQTIISATGTWTNPFIPDYPGLASFRGKQLHTANYRGPADFAGKRTLVVGGGLSAVQLLLEIAPVAQTTWSTRRPPQFHADPFGAEWGTAVEQKVKTEVLGGKAPGSVVGYTGIPPLPHYLQGVKEGVLVSRGPLAKFFATGAEFGGKAAGGAALEEPPVIPESWQPYPAETRFDFDALFWNTGFDHALSHLESLRLRTSQGGLRMVDEVRTANPRVFVAGYGSGASTIGGVRTGRAAARAATRYLASK